MRCIGAVLECLKVAGTEEGKTVKQTMTWADEKIKRPHVWLYSDD